MPDWTTRQDYEGWFVADSGGIEVCRLPGRDEFSRSEAEFIARACNAHGPLVEALEAALEQTEDGLHQSPCDVPDCWVEAARAALLAARADYLAKGTLC